MYSKVDKEKIILVWSKLVKKGIKANKVTRAVADETNTRLRTVQAVIKDYKDSVQKNVDLLDPKQKQPEQLELDWGSRVDSLEKKVTAIESTLSELTKDKQPPTKEETSAESDASRKPEIRVFKFDYHARERLRNAIRSYSARIHPKQDGKWTESTSELIQKTTGEVKSFLNVTNWNTISFHGVRSAALFLHSRISSSHGGSEFFDIYILCDAFRTICLEKNLTVIEG